MISLFFSFGETLFSETFAKLSGHSRTSWKSMSHSCENYRMRIRE